MEEQCVRWDVKSIGHSSDHILRGGLRALMRVSQSGDSRKRRGVRKIAEQ